MRDGATFKRDPQSWPVLERILTLRSDGESTTAIAAAQVCPGAQSSA